MIEAEWSIDIPTDVFFGVSIGILILIAVAALVAILVRLVRTWQPTHQQRAVDDLSRKMNLTVPDHVREPLARAIAVRKRGAEIGSTASLITFLLVLRPWSTPTPGLDLVGIIPAIALIVAGTSLGAVVGGLFARRIAPTGHRAARITPLKFSDLIAPMDRRLVVGTLIAGVVLPTALTLLTNGPWRTHATISTADVLFFQVAGLLTAALGLTLPRIGRMLVSKRAIPGDAHALAWSDALAARTVRDLAHLVATVGALAGMLSFMAIGLTFPSSWENIADAWISLSGYLVLGVMVTVVVMAALREPERHVQRTLWPQFAADAK